MKTKGVKMKKMMMIAAMLAVVGSAIAGDVYNIKMVCNTPVIKEGAMYYKDFVKKTYQGYVDVNYNLDGTIANPCDAVIYGDFNGVKTFKAASFDFTVANIYGKNRDKVESGIGVSMDSAEFTLCGNGNCKLTKNPSCNTCGDGTPCSISSKITQLNGTLVGFVSDVLCAPCNDKSWTWVYNTCVSVELPEGDLDTVSGNWSIKYNKSLTAECGEDFLNCIEDKIPKAYK